MRALKFILTFSTLFVSAILFSQNGFIRGTVYDDATGEYLPGVTIYIEGSTIGTLTDLDGKFSLSVDPGIYDLRVSFISYETQVISGLEVKAGEVALFENLRLKETAVELTEITITAQAVRNTEAAMLTMKRKSANVIDGISAVNFRKIGDSDAAASIKRVSGVSVEGGKYVFVRGLGDRYTKTILNGVDIPGLDPDRNTLQMDIFPTNIIDNIVVYKTFTADLPADFTGGVIDITTKDFPEELKGNVSVGLGYNPDFHFNSNYLTYKGGKTDWLGFDDGTRDIPATEDIPFFSEAASDPDGPKAARYREILESFNPNLAAYEQMSLMDYSLGLSLGNQKAGEKVTWGYIFSLSYKSETEFYTDAEFGRYGLNEDINVSEMTMREFQIGDYGVSSVLISGLAGVAMKTKNTKIRLDMMHLQNGESKAGIFDYTSNDQGAIFYGFQHNLEYSQRSLTNLMLHGKHSFPVSRWEIEWKLSPTLSRIADPDIRFTRYEDRDGTWSIGTEVGFPERIWRDLEEINGAGKLDIAKGFDFLGQKAEVKFGGSYVYKQRDFIIRNYALNIRNMPLTGDPDELFRPENLWPREGVVSSGTTYDAPFIPDNPNQYDANINSMAGYATLDISPFSKLKTILGVRFENYVQRYTGQDQQKEKVLDNAKVLDNTGLFPSLNLIYGITDKMNLRFSYTKTIARPSFKELSFAEIYDPVSSRTFIGGLFTDEDKEAGEVYWDGNLVSTNIHNMDLRYEVFLEGGQMFSLSGFYKKFLKPIEIVQYATQAGSFQPRNVGDGEVYGAELEFRVSLKFIAESMRNFNFSSNVTYTYSRVELSNIEYESRIENARTGQTVEKFRDMAGQAPFIINAGLGYDGGEQGFWQGVEAGIYYNVQGSTLVFVGIVDRPDIYSVPFHSLNFNASKSLGKDDRWRIGFKVENLLMDKKESVFKSYEAEDQYFTRLNPGIDFKITISYSLF